MEPCNIEWQVVIITILKKNKCEKTKWLPEEALKIAEKIREVKGKGQRERYTKWNADFQRMARGYKKVLILNTVRIRGK